VATAIARKYWFFAKHVAKSPATKVPYFSGFFKVVATLLPAVAVAMAAFGNGGNGDIRSRGR
jgi:hypothetical protein